MIYETWCETCRKPKKVETNMMDMWSDLELDNLFKEDKTVKNNKNSATTTKRKHVNVEANGPYYRYIGETSRSVFERGCEHYDDLYYGRTRSHMLKHCVLKHPNMDPLSIDFRIKIVSSHKSAFERQIKEAVLIHNKL